MIDSLALGGAESLAAVFAGAADPERLRVEVCALKSLGGNPLAAELGRRGVPFEVVGSAGLRDVGAFRRLLARLRRDPPDLLHAHLTDATIWGAALAHRLERPCVASLHVLPGTAAVAGWRGALRRRLELRALGRVDAVLAVSAAVRQAWVGAGLPPDRVEVVHNGVDTAALAAAADDPTTRQALRREIGVAPGAPLLVAVSVLRAGKGLGTLLAAFERVLAARPDARLAVVGDGPEAERLGRTAEPLGDRVVWAGYRAEVAPWLAAADLFVLPSRGDAFPTALLEAAAAGLPAVAAASGGVPEIVADGETGVLVPPGRAAELAVAIERLLADPARRAAMGRAARRRAEERFSLAAWSARLEAVYRRVAAPPPAAARERPLRIAVVEPAARGGMIHYAHQLCCALADAGAEPILVTARADELAGLPHRYRRLELLRLWDPKPAGRRAPRLPSPLRRAWRAVAWYREQVRLLAWVARERPDVVQLGDVRFAGDLLPILVLSRLGPPLVDVCHNVRPFATGGRRAGWFAAGRLTRWLYRRIYRRFDRVVVHFEANRRDFLAETGLPAERVAATVHGNQDLFAELADPAVTPATLRRRLGLPSAAPVLLLFGTLAPYKGADLAIEAHARLVERHPAARLVVAGFPLPGFDLDAHRRLADRLGAGSRVIIAPGYVPTGEVAAWMELAAVVVLPYRQVFQSGVLPAAQTFGRPIVAAAVGALPEAVEDGRTGLLVPPGDAAALATAIDGLLADPDRARRMGEAAAAAAHGRFAWSRVAADLLAVHREAIAARGRAA